MERAEREAAALQQHQGYSARAAAVAAGLFGRQRKVVLAKLTGQKARKGTRHWKTPGGRAPVVTKVISAADVFDQDRWDGEWVDDMGAVYDDVYTQVSPQVANALEQNDYDPAAAGVAAAIAALVARQAGASARANQTTAAQIQAAIDQVEESGGTTDDLTAAVGGVFDQADQTRAGMIGDYVATGALAGAAMLGAAWATSTAAGNPPGDAISGADDSGQPLGPDGTPVDSTGIQKVWVTVQDEKVRPWHADADGQTVAIDQPFSVNGEDMMYPGDPDGSAENVINCRCYLVFTQAGQDVGTADTGEAPADALTQARLLPYRLDRKHGVVLARKDVLWGGDSYGGETALATAPPASPPAVCLGCRRMVLAVGRCPACGSQDLHVLKYQDADSGEYAGSDATPPEGKAADEGTRDYRDDDVHAPQDAICLDCRSQVSSRVAPGSCPKCGSAQLHALEGPAEAGRLPRVGLQAESQPVGRIPDIKASAVAITVAGLVVKAKDTGRILMIQRAQDIDDDPASGMWEWPGGHREGAESPLAAARREWEEETGCELPAGHVAGDWVAGNGFYQAFVWVIARQDLVPLNCDPENRDVLNPDDPDGDMVEVAAWWDIEDLPGMPALREECRAAYWDLIREAKGDVAGHSFHGNQWTGGIGGGGDARTGLPRTSFIDPKTGEPMTRTQIGAVGEELFNRTAGPDLADKLGGPLEHLSEGPNRTAPLDYRADHQTGVEVKTISSEAANQKTAISAEEKERKYAEAERLGLPRTATVLQVLDLNAGTLKVAYSDGIVSKSFSSMTPVGTYDVGPHLADLGYKRYEHLDFEEKLAHQAWLVKGEGAGHPFRGNQHTGGIGGGGAEEGRLAAGILGPARQMEPAVTGHLSDAADVAGAKLVGLDYRLKTGDSLAEKIGRDAAEQGISKEEAAGRVGDALRYTATLEPDRYTSGVRSMTGSLRAAGYEPVDGRWKNTWEPPTNIYRGLNTAWANRAGDRFEVQFHTPDSFALKQGENHAAYETIRDPGTDAATRAVLQEESSARSAALGPSPAGADTLMRAP